MPIKEKDKMKAQKVEMRVYQLTEEAKNTQNSLQNNKKDCNIFWIIYLLYLLFNYLINLNNVYIKKCK